MAQKGITILFLISFLIGLLQPVLPLVEYYVFKESIIELFCENREVPESDCEGTCYLADQLKKSDKQSQSPGNLINFEEIPNSWLVTSPLVQRLTAPEDNLRNNVHQMHPEKMPYGVFHPPRS